MALTYQVAVSGEAIQARRRRRWRPASAVGVSVAVHLALAGGFLELTPVGDAAGKAVGFDASEQGPTIHVSLVRVSQGDARQSAPQIVSTALDRRPSVPASQPLPTVAREAEAPIRLAAVATRPMEEARPVPARSGGEAADAQGDAQGQSDFRKRLFDHIQQFVVYPSDVQTEGVYGTPQVLFRMDRNGRVLGVWLRRTSGFPALDAAAVAAVWRAQPLPAIPAGLPDTLSLTAPVEFTPPQQSASG